MKKLILDYSKWRCGGGISDYNKNALGEGLTYLLNTEGYMCCLGQFSLQIAPKLKEKDIKGRGTPAGTNTNIGCLTKIHDGSVFNSTLSDLAMNINDDPNTTPEEKIAELKKLFLTHDYEIEVINKPE